MRKNLIIPTISLTLILVAAGVLIYQNVRKPAVEMKEEKVEAKKDEEKVENGKNVVESKAPNVPPPSTTPTSPAPTQPAAPSPKPAATFSTYSNPQFSIKYPSKWELEVEGEAKALFYPPGVTRNLDQFSEAVIVSAFDITGAPFTDLTGYASFLTNTFGEAFKDYKLIETTSVPLGGQIGHKLVFSGITPDGRKVKTLNLVTLVDNTGYSIVYSVKEAVYSTHLKNVQEMIDSYRILGQIKSAIPEPAGPVTYSTYSGPSFSFQYPSNLVQENIEGGVNFFDSSSGFTLTATIIEISPEEQQLTLDEWGNQISSGYGSTLEKYTVTKEGNAVISDVTASLRNYTAEVNGRAFTGFLGVVIGNNKVYTLIAVAETSVYNMNLEQVQKFVETFIIKALPEAEVTPEPKVTYEAYSGYYFNVQIPSGWGNQGLGDGVVQFVPPEDDTGLIFFAICEEFDQLLTLDELANQIFANIDIENFKLINQGSGEISHRAGMSYKFSGDSNDIPQTGFLSLTTKDDRSYYTIVLTNSDLYIKNEEQIKTYIGSFIINR